MNNQYIHSALIPVIVAGIIFFTTFTGLTAANDHEEMATDVLVYGATPSGIMAALTVKEGGRSVLVVEPGKWVGGILGAGLKPTQDMPNFTAVGGMTRGLMLRLGVRTDEAPIDLSVVNRLTYRGMSPKYVREDFLRILEDNDIQVVFDHRVSRVEKNGSRIVAATFDYAPFHQDGYPPAHAEVLENLRVSASVFVDASYEGELMARSGVSYVIGRESSLDYDEELAGVRPLGNVTPIDPFVEPGNPESGLLPMVTDDHGKPEGAGDHYTQAYNFRFYVTSDPVRRVPIEAPDDYNPMDYELLGRYVEFLKEDSKDEKELFQRLRRIFPGWPNRGEYNYQRSSLITMAPLNVSHLYAKGDYATKSRVWKGYQDYIRGLHHFLATDNRVPEAFRKSTSELGLDGYHHPDTAGWPHQLYIRVSRRMVGRKVITAHDVYNRTQVDDPIGLAQYGIDTYPSRRIWFEKDGQFFVATEGDMFVGRARGPTNVPYPISYGAITPQRHECTNLLVSVLFSSSHLGYASARMEPTFMIAGESAGIAALHALEEHVSVQDIDMGRFLAVLRERGQRLSWEEAQALDDRAL